MYSNCDGIMFQILGEIVNMLCPFFSPKAWISAALSDFLESLFACYLSLMSLPYLLGTSTKIPESWMDPKLSIWNPENTSVLSYSQDLKKTVSEVATLFLVIEWRQPIGKHSNIYKNNLLLYWKLIYLPQRVIVHEMC